MNDETKENEQILHSQNNFDNPETANDEDFPAEINHKPIIDAQILRETLNKPAIEIESPEAELTGIAALLSNLKTDSDVSILITRLKDGLHKNQFRQPCEESGKVDTVAWDGEPYPDALYTYIRKTYGGGRYRFQLRYNGGFKESWTDTLLDPAELSDKEKLERKQKTNADEQPRTVESSQLFANPKPPEEKKDALQELIDQADKFNQLRAILSPSPGEAPPPPAVLPAANDEPRITKDTIKMLLIEKALDRPNLLEKAVESVFDIESKETRYPGFWESIAQSFATNDQVQSMLINGLSAVAAPIAGLVMTKFMPPPQTTTVAAPPILRSPQINTPQQQPPAPQTTAEMPMTEPTAPTAPTEPANPLPSLPLITLQ